MHLNPVAVIAQVHTGALDKNEFWTSVGKSVNVNLVYLFFKEYKTHTKC